MNNPCDCPACQIDTITKSLLVDKAERFQTEYSPTYWKAKQPSQHRKFLEACDVIQSMSGLIIHLLDTEDEECV